MALLSDSARYLVGRGMSAAISFSAIAIYTHLLTTAQYGYYALTVSGVGLANTVTYHWLRFGLTRFKTTHGHNEEAFLSTVLGAFGVSTAIIGVVAGFATLLLADYAWHRLLLAGVLVLLGQAWFELNLELARARFQSTTYGFLSTLRNSLALIGGVILIQWGLGEYGPLVAVASASPLAVLAVMRRSWKGIRLQHIDGAIARQLLAYGYPLIATAFFAFIINSTDRFMIAGMLGPKEAGEYAPSYDLAQQSLGMLMYIMYLAGFPRITLAFERSGETEVRRAISSYMSLFGIVAIPAAVGLYLVSPNAASVLLGQGFHASAVIIMPVIAGATLLSGLKAYYVDIAFQLGRKTHHLIWIGAVSALLNVILNYAWIGQFGIVGAAYATLVSYGLSLSLGWMVARTIIALPAINADVIKGIIAALVMAGALWKLKTLAGATGLVVQIGVGLLVVGIVLFILNAYGARSHLIKRLNNRRYKLF